MFFLKTLTSCFSSDNWTNSANILHFVTSNFKGWMQFIVTSLCARSECRLKLGLLKTQLEACSFPVQSWKCLFLFFKAKLNKHSFATKPVSIVLFFVKFLVLTPKSICRGTLSFMWMFLLSLDYIILEQQVIGQNSLGLLKGKLHDIRQVIICTTSKILA